MKTVWAPYVGALAGLVLATSAFAQVPTRAGGPRVGLGVAVTDAGEALVTAGSGSGQPSGFMPGIFVPIRVTPRFRLEPEIAFYRNSSTDSSGPSDQVTASVRIGLGGFGLLPVDRFTFSYGARVGYLRSITTLTNPGGALRIDAPGWFVAPAAGGEYFFADYLSLGAEVQLRFTSWKWTESGSNRSEASVATKSALVVRFHFP